MGKAEDGLGWEPHSLLLYLSKTHVCLYYNNLKDCYLLSSLHRNLGMDAELCFWLGWWGVDFYFEVEKTLVFACGDPKGKCWKITVSLSATRHFHFPDQEGSINAKLSQVNGIYCRSHVLHGAFLGTNDQEKRYPVLRQSQRPLALPKGQEPPEAKADTEKEQNRKLTSFSCKVNKFMNVCWGHSRCN